MGSPLAPHPADPDQEALRFICLQEVDHYEDCFEPFLNSLGYDGTFSQRRLEPNPISTDGAALFWRRDRFAPATRTRKLFLRIAEHSKVFGLMHVFSYGGGEDKSSSYSSSEGVSSSAGGGDTTIGVACVHLSAKDKGAERMEEIDTILHATELILPSQVTFIVGDLNDTPTSDVCEKLQARGYMDTHLSFSTWKRRATGEVKRCIDYIWHNPRDLAVDFCTANFSEYTDECIPTATHPRDHLPLSVSYPTS